MDWESFRLALGAFLASPGFGGAAVLFTAWATYRGVESRLAANRQLAKEARAAEAQEAADEDARGRWWELLQWVYEHAEAMNQVDPLLAQRSLEAIEGLVQTREQAIMLSTVSPLVVPYVPEPEEVENA